MTAKHEIRDWWADKPMTYAAEHGETRFVDGEEDYGFLQGLR